MMHEHNIRSAEFPFEILDTIQSPHPLHVGYRLHFVPASTPAVAYRPDATAPVRFNESTVALELQVMDIPVGAQGMSRRTHAFAASREAWGKIQKHREET